MELLGLICNGVHYCSQLMYIDPAATSVLLSSVAAIAVAIAASAIIIWKKVKNNMKKIIKTDPNKNKEVEKDVVLVDEEVLDNEKTEEVKTETTAEGEATEEKEVKEGEVKEENAQTEEKPAQDQQNSEGDNGEDKK